MLIYKAFGRVQPLQNLIFSDKNSIENSYFFWCLILDVIFCHFGVSWCQKARFWDPLGAQLDTKWRPKSPKWRQNASQFLVRRLPFSWLISKVTFGALLGTILVDFGTPMAPKSLIFARFFDTFWLDFKSFFSFWDAISSKIVDFPHDVLHIFVLDRCCQN